MVEGGEGADVIFTSNLHRMIVQIEMVTDFFLLLVVCVFVFAHVCVHVT